MVDLSLIASHMANIAGAYAFISLAILVILYLIRPKPKKKTLPSLLFLIKEQKKNTKYSFLQRLLQDLLFIIQFLMLFLLAAAATEPFYRYLENVGEKNVALVVDVSASVAAGGRMEQIKEAALKDLGEKVSIVLVGTQPSIVLDHGTRDDAEVIIGSLKPKASTSAIGDAMLVADKLLGKEKGTVRVLSDFINTHGVDPFLAKKSLELKSRVVEFIDFNDKLPNIGIVEMMLSKEEVIVFIKNYNQQKQEVSVNVNGNKVDISIEPGLVQKISFKPDDGITKISIDKQDAFMVDNYAYISNPPLTKPKILVLTNNGNAFLKAALDSYKQYINPDVTIEYSNPPILPVMNHDIYILTEVEKSKMPPVIFKELAQQVENGKHLIVLAQNNLWDMDELLPLDVGKSIRNETAILNQYTINEITTDINFRKVKQYYSVSAPEDTITLATTEDNISIITLNKQGLSNIVYFGIFNDYGDFKFDMTYPLFWQQLVDYLVKANKIEDFNMKAGDTLMYQSKVSYYKPNSENAEKANNIELDEIGVYSIGDRKIAVNLVNELESDISHVSKPIMGEGYAFDTSTLQKKQSLVPYLIIAALIFVIVEVAYIKIRGDL